MSAPSHRAWRDAIRRTWFQPEARRSLALRFIIGAVHSAELEASLALEALAFGDVVRVPVLDSYDALIYKLLHFFDWAVVHFEFQFLLRANDDTYVQLDALRRMLRRYGGGSGGGGGGNGGTDGGSGGGGGVAAPKLYLGAVYTGRPIRSRKHKNFVDRRCYRWSAFPPYVHGPYLVLSAAVVHAVVARESTLRRRIIVGCGSLEDMQIGLWLFDPLGPLRVRASHTPNFVPFFHCHARATAVSDLWVPRTFDDVHAHWARGRGLCHRSLREAALDVFRGRIGLGAADAQHALNSLAITLLLLGELERAAGALRAAVRRAPTYRAGQVNLGRVEGAIAARCERNSTCLAHMARMSDSGLQQLCAQWPAISWRAVGV
eukprot:g566.t1